jgi:hypothetical protein
VTSPPPILQKTFQRLKIGEDIYSARKESNGTVIYYFLLDLFIQIYFYFDKVTENTSIENDWKVVVGPFPLNII